MKATYFFIEKNTRLEMKRNRQITLEIPDELFKGYNVDGMEKHFRTHMNKHSFHDSTLTLKSIKIGNTHFQL